MAGELHTRWSWVPPDTAARVRSLLFHGRSSWEEVFDPAADEVRAGEPPDDVTREEWPRLAAHVARTERVREVVARTGLRAAELRFGDSPHAVERAALLTVEERDDAAAFAGLLACAIDEWLAYGQFLSRLLELGLRRDPAGTVAVFEQFVSASLAFTTTVPSWPERVRAARDGLAAVYVRVGRKEDAERVYGERYLEEPADTTVAIGAGRAFLEAGDVARATSWLSRAVDRAAAVGRESLAERLRAKVVALRARMS